MLIGLDTKVVELSNQILAPVDYEVACFAQNEMREKGVELILSDGVKLFKEKEIELNSGKTIPYYDYRYRNFQKNYAKQTNFRTQNKR